MLVEVICITFEIVYHVYGHNDDYVEIGDIYTGITGLNLQSEIRSNEIYMFTH